MMASPHKYTRRLGRGMVPFRAITALAVATCLALGSAYADPSLTVRGVSPADQELFRNGIRCPVRGALQVIDSARVNDDYCDCDDGKDEPATAACSHLVESVFYCDNGGFFPRHIHTSLLNDGVCDCCDGSDEYDFSAGGATCTDTCAVEAAEFRKHAEIRLADIEIGYAKREAELKTVVGAHFTDIQEKNAQTEKTMASLTLLKERVEVHLAREERREKKMRLETARQRQARDDDTEAPGATATDTDAVNPPSPDSSSAGCVENAETGTTCDNPDPEATGDGESFEEITATEADTDDDVAATEDDAAEKDATAADESDSRPTVTTMVELSDGTRVSLADYLRLEHHHGPTKKLRTQPRSADQKRREDFLGPLLNGGEEDRKRMGLYLLRSLGLVVSPLRLVVEALLFLPRLLWDVLSSSVIVSPYLEKLPSSESMIHSPTFRRIGGGHVYRLYKQAAWGSRVVWDAPIVAYHPDLDLDLKLPEAESLRKILQEIQGDTDKLRKDNESQQSDLAFDYGVDHAYYLLKDQCIEKKIEKYTYKLCAFKEVKQDYTNLGKWEAWGVATTPASPGGGGGDDQQATDYSVMNFTKGQRCWNGPDRSVKVLIECGANNEILSVDEPSTCVYEMRAQSYVACTTEVLEEAKANVAFWSKSK